MTCSCSEFVRKRKEITGKKGKLLTGASPRVALRIICTKMKCLPSRLIYNLLAWGTSAPFLARTTHVTRVSTANSFQRAEACQTRLEILPASPKKYYVRIHTNILFFLLYVSFLSVVYIRRLSTSMFVILVSIREILLSGDYAKESKGENNVRIYGVITPLNILWRTRISDINHYNVIFLSVKFQRVKSFETQIPRELCVSQSFYRLINPIEKNRG